eukprot:TRINITY_DN20186_c0_g1_i5.p1 TRINITY_DN20186_c0_g1~~TRINITY_DN20186_c0_g1_i5.p1  ORF type:complete len:165 (+),score=28.06 TRINITY_DN20186_c0_g1_i5:180-674(+)
MIPVLIVLFGHNLLPEELVSQLLPQWSPSPYYALLIAVALYYLPFGLSLLYKMYLTNGKVNNLEPRKQSEILAATHPAFARLAAADKNMQEGFPLFAAALLAALQSGVPRAVISDYAVLWIIARTGFVLIYAIQTNNLLGACRTMSFAVSICCVSKLLMLAASQ